MPAPSEHDEEQSADQLRDAALKEVARLRRLFNDQERKRSPSEAEEKQREERLRVAYSEAQERHKAELPSPDSKPTSGDFLIDPTVSLGELIAFRNELERLKKEARVWAISSTERVYGARSASVAVRRRLEAAGPEAAAHEVEYPVMGSSVYGPGRWVTV